VEGGIGLEVQLQSVYMLSVEPPGDYIFTPSGVVIVMNNQSFKVYCISSSHNLFRAALYRHSWDELEHGVVFKETSFRLANITEDMKKQGWTHADSIPAILDYLYTQNSKQLFFLQRYITAE
jgi:hypothetical protein